jgi:hypothetical protein
VLEQFFNSPPPPPPPGAGILKNDGKVITSASLRERLEQHRQDPTCASCHVRMDPLGFALENYDGIGAWRTKDGSFKIDATGKLPDGATFDGPAELKKLLVSRKKQFVQCLTEKMLTYALGRGLESYDQCAVEEIAAKVEKENYRFSSLVMGIAESGPFQMRNGEGAKS